MRPSFRRLLAWRLRHLAAASFRLMTRRWQAVALLLLMASPRMMPPAEQLRLLAAPVRAMLRPGGLATSLGLWAATLALAAAWGTLAPGVVDGGAAWRHLHTLPIDRRLLRRVDLAVLAVADLPLMLPFIAAIVTWLRLPPAEFAASLAATLALASQLPLLQAAVLERSPRGLIASVAGSAIGLAVVAIGGNPWLLVGCIAIGSAVSSRQPVDARRGGARPPPRALRLAEGSATWAMLARLHLRALLAPMPPGRPFELLGWMLAPPWLAWLLPRLGLRPEIAPIVVLLLLPPLIFAVGGRAFDLRRLHEPMRGLLASLGLGRRRVAAHALGALATVAVPALAPSALALAITLGSSRSLWLLPVGGLAMLACASLSLRGDRGVFLPKAAIAVGGTVALMVLLLP